MEWVSGAIFCLLGGIFLLIGIAGQKKAAKSAAWPTASGTVLSSSIIEKSSMDDDGASSSSYEPRVVYQYSIMGTAYEGKRISFGANQFDRRMAEKISAAYPAGAQVTVHYNPEKPGEGVLETKARGGMLFTVLGIILLVIGVVVLLIKVI